MAFYKKIKLFGLFTITKQLKPGDIVPLAFSDEHQLTVYILADDEARVVNFQDCQTTDRIWKPQEGKKQKEVGPISFLRIISSSVIWKQDG